MENDLTAFLCSRRPFTQEMLRWPTGTLRLACYLTDSTPPRPYVTSARAVVTDGHRVLVVQDPDNCHILPGGRLERGETPADAVRREVMEETGWSLVWIRPIGILHFTLIDPKPEDYIYPYPDFIQSVYAGRPDAYFPERKETDGYELGAEFMHVTAARRLPLDAGQQEFLNAAIQCLCQS